MLKQLSGLVLMGMFIAPVSAETVLTASKVDEAPLVDGLVDDAAWASAQALVTHDTVADIDLTLKAVHSADQIFILAQFPDSTENLMQKALLWDKGLEIYKTGPRREDTFVIKWNMEPLPIDLTVSSDDSYLADLWFWKAHRTDHAGYADDKHQIYTDIPHPKGQQLLSKTGNTFYLVRKGDEGKSAYKGNIPVDYQGDEIGSYAFRQPQGSRADVKAKGVWSEGVWTVEFSRKFDTGHQDDVVLMPGQAYQFGVSRYEIAGRKADSRIEIPLYGAGEISESLTLEFR